MPGPIKKTTNTSRRASVQESMPDLSMCDSVSDVGSDNLSAHADAIVAAGTAATAAGLMNMARPGVTPLSLTLHNAEQAPLDPLSMWKANSDNARIERLFCGLAKQPTAATSAAVQRWLADESLAGLPCNANSNGGASTRNSAR